MLVKAGRNQQPLLYQESHSYEKKHSLFKGQQVRYGQVGGMAALAE
jgi:hypothetical protein